MNLTIQEEIIVSDSDIHLNVPSAESQIMKLSIVGTACQLLVGLVGRQVTSSNTVCMLNRGSAMMPHLTIRPNVQNVNMKPVGAAV